MAKNFSVGKVNLTRNPVIPGVTSSEGFGTGATSGQQFTPEIMNLLGQMAPQGSPTGMDRFKQYFQNPQVQQSLGQLAPLLFGIFGGPEMGAGALKTFDTQAAIRRQQEEIDAERQQREAALGISRERLGIEREEAKTKAEATKALAGYKTEQDRIDRIEKASTRFETGLTKIDTSDTKKVAGYAASIAKTAGLNPADTTAFVEQAQARAALPPEPTKESTSTLSYKLAELEKALGVKLTPEQIERLGGIAPPKEAADTGLTAKVKDFKDVFGRDPSQVELQRMAGVAPPQPPASIQIAQMQDIGALADALGRGEAKVSEVPVAVRGEVLAEAKRRGYEVVSDVERERMGQLKKAEPVLKSIDQLSERINTGQGAIAKITGAVEKAKAMANLNDDVAEYEALVSGFTPLVARAVGHTGVLTEQDVQSVRTLFPRPGDSKSLRDRKVKRLKEIFGGVQQAIETSVTTPYSNAPAPTPGANVVVQENKKTGEFRHSLDGGKTWQKGKPNQK